MGGPRAAVLGSCLLVCCNPFLPARQASYPRAVDVIELATKDASAGIDPFALTPGPEGNEEARLSIEQPGAPDETWTCKRIHRMDGACNTLVVSCTSAGGMGFWLTLRADGYMRAGTSAALVDARGRNSWFELRTQRPGDAGSYIGRTRSSPGSSHLVRMLSTDQGVFPVRRARPDESEFNEFTLDDEKVFLSLHREHPQYALVLTTLTVIAESWVEAAPHFRACVPAPPDPDADLVDM